MYDFQFENQMCTYIFIIRTMLDSNNWLLRAKEKCLPSFQPGGSLLLPCCGKAGPSYDLPACLVNGPGLGPLQYLGLQVGSALGC